MTTTGPVARPVPDIDTICRRWLVTARGLNADVNTVGEAREELRHLAATALATEEINDVEATH